MRGIGGGEFARAANTLSITTVYITATNCNSKTRQPKRERKNSYRAEPRWFNKITTPNNKSQHLEVAIPPIYNNKCMKNEKE